MKALIIAFLLVSALFLGCAQTQESSNQEAENSVQATEENLIAEVDKTIISDSEEIELGEMI